MTGSELSRPEWRSRGFALPLESPLGTARGEIQRREGHLVGIVVDGHLRGVGEATPLPGWTESAADCAAALEAVTTTDPRSGRLPDAATPAARFAVGVAHRDRLARRRGVSLATTLAADPPASVPVNATVGDGGVEETVAAAETAVAEGFGTLKLKVGVRDPATDRERVRAVADAITDGSTADPAAPGPTLRVDANGAWDRGTAREMVTALADRVAYVEQPVPAADLAGLAALRGVGAPVAADEALATHGPRAVVAADAADVLVCKPAAVGGLEDTLAVARTAATRGVDTVVTTTIDGVIARTAATHLAAAVANVTGSPTTRAHGLATGSLLAGDLQSTDGDPLPDPVPVAEGCVPVPDAGGLAGTAFDGSV
ncbi:MAG: L-alanine-DL-glutamate epimerase related enzymes of enolase superfamily [halophilic archaeon J07HB67]|nr:MAG: L-alanine-DL-glutamate epimerase related enzymes of enolase superfamily [halophilic archaeon J07HB67]